MQDECSGKTGKHRFTWLDTAERSLSYAKIMQDESNGKTGKHHFTWLDTAEPQLILCKDNVNSCSDKINYGCFMHE